MYQFYNPNPVRSDSVGDCSVRAVAKALRLTWEEAFTELAVSAFLMGDVISSDAVWGATLRKHGFNRSAIPNSCPDCYTVADFCEDHPYGTYVLKSDGHVATVVDGTLYDSWNSLSQIPQYFWTNERMD